MSKPRPKLDAATLRWVADDLAAEADRWQSWEDEAVAEGLKQSDAVVTRIRNHRRMAARLRNIATREEKRRG